MVWQPPPEWDQYIDGFGNTLAPPVDLSIPTLDQQQQFALPGELAKGTVDPAPPPPPPPPPQTIAAPGVPVADEVPAGAIDNAPQPAPAAPDHPAMLQEAPQPPPLLHPDAISGGYTPEQVATVTGAVDAQGADTRSLLPDNPIGGEDLGKLLSTLPVEQQEEFRRKVEDGRQKVLDAGKLEADTTRLRDAEDSARIYQDSVRDAQQRAKELDVEARQLADENPLDSISGGRKILGVLSAIVGGFMANKTGRNMGLEAVDQIANDAAQLHAQKLQLNARQQAGIGDQIARAGDANKASEAVRLAVYDGAIKKLETDVQNFDPRGTTALRTMDDINALKQRRADVLAKYLQGEQKRLEDQRKYELDAMKARGQYAKDMADVAKTQAETAKLHGQLGGAAKPADIANPPEFYVARNLKAPPFAMTQKEYDSWLKMGKASEEFTKVQRENSPEERNRQFSVGEIVDDQGDPVQFRSTEFAGKLAETKASVDQVSQLADEMIDLYAQHGFESDFLKSEGWKQAQGAFASALLAAKNADQLGALSGSDIDLEAKQITGGVDVTGVRDPTSALQSFKRRMAGKLNAKVRAEAVLPKGRQVKPWTPSNTAASTMPRAEVTPEQKTVEEITAFDPKRSLTARDLQSLGIDPSGVKAQGGRLNTEISTALERNGGIPPRIKQQIDSLRNMANDADPKKRDFATQALSNIAKDALDDNVKAYATANAFDPAAVAAPNLSKEEVR